MLKNVTKEIQSPKTFAFTVFWVFWNFTKLYNVYKYIVHVPGIYFSYLRLFSSMFSQLHYFLDLKVYEIGIHMYNSMRACIEFLLICHGIWIFILKSCMFFSVIENEHLRQYQYPITSYEISCIHPKTDMWNDFGCFIAL